MLAEHETDLLMLFVSAWTSKLILTVDRLRVITLKWYMVPPKYLLVFCIRLLFTVYLFINLFLFLSAATSSLSFFSSSFIVHFVKQQSTKVFCMNVPFTRQRRLAKNSGRVNQHNIKVLT